MSSVPVERPAGAGGTAPPPADTGYGIEMSPELQTVSTDAPVEYWLRGPQFYQAMGSPRSEVSYAWHAFVTNESLRKMRADMEKRGFTSMSPGFHLGPRGEHAGSWKTKWTLAGQVRITCVVQMRDGPKIYVEREHWIAEESAVLAQGMDQARTLGQANPDAELSTVIRTLLALKAQPAPPDQIDRKKYPADALEYLDERAGGPRPPTMKEEHEALIKQLEEYAKKLSECLSDSQGKARVALVAQHYMPGGSRHRPQALRVFLARMSGDDHPHGQKTWQLVDWTSPTVRAQTGKYTGLASSDQEAVRGALKAWDSGNRYGSTQTRYRFPGTILYEASSQRFALSIRGDFPTDGLSSGDEIRLFFQFVGEAIAVLGVVVLLLVPVPGSAVLATLLWTGIIATTVSATIGIAQRHNEGFNNWKEDAVDILTIVGNVLGAAKFIRGAVVARGTKWQRGATVVIPENLKSRVGVKFDRGILIGEFTKEGIEAVFIASDQIAAYEAIMNDRTLTPEDRIEKLMEFFAGVALAAGMKYIATKGLVEDWDKLGHKPAAKSDSTAKAGAVKGQTTGGEKPPGDWKKAGDREATIILAEPTKIQAEITKGRSGEKGGSKQAKEKNTVVATAVSQNSRKPPRPSGNEEFAPATYPEKRGMRKRDDRVLSSVARDEGKIILVRNSNAAALDYVGKPGYKAKSPTMKEKTRQTPPNKGLVAADPNDPRFKQFLEDEGLSYDEYCKKLEADGTYTIGTPAEGYVLRDQEGAAFYSDYDLHGVYDGRSPTSSAYTEEFKGKLNEQFNGEIIQHGPHDDWPGAYDEAKGGANYGPQPPVTAYLPDGTSVHLETIADMKRFYSAHGIPWRYDQ